MATLSARDVHAVLELVGEAHHAETLDGFRAGLLPAIRRVIACDWISYNEVRADGTVHAALIDPLPDAQVFAAWDRYARQNPIVAHYLETRDGRAYRFSDLITQAELHDLDLYRYVYGPMGVEYQLAVELPGPPDLTIGIALSRGEPDFTMRDRAVLDLARPHLIQAWRNVQLRAPAAALPAPALLHARLERLGLTRREAQILAMLMRGRSTASVAAELSISPRTLHKHAERIHQKLGVHTRAAAVASAWASVTG